MQILKLDIESLEIDKLDIKIEIDTHIELIALHEGSAAAQQ
jgi:hypothetical protein